MEAAAEQVVMKQDMAVQTDDWEAMETGDEQSPRVWRGWVEGTEGLTATKGESLKNPSLCKESCSVAGLENGEHDEGSAVDYEDDESYHESDYDLTPEEIAECEAVGDRAYAAAAELTRARLWDAKQP